MDEMKMNELNPEELEGVSGGSAGSKNPLPAKAGCIVYKVQNGQNLTWIANNFGTTVDAIMSVNVGIISNKNVIRAGYYIYVPV